MKTTATKMAIAITITASFFCLSATALGAEKITVRDFSKDNPAILPHNPFYFLKDWGREVRRFFITNPIESAITTLYEANQKAAELSLTTKWASESARPKALTEYYAGLKGFTGSLMKLTRDDVAQGYGEMGGDEFLNYVSERLVMHLRFIWQMEETSPGEDQEKILETAESEVMQMLSFIGQKLDTAEAFSDRLKMLARSSNDTRVGRLTAAGKVKE